MKNPRLSVLDFETSYQIKDKKKDPSPFHPKNFLVSYGLNDNYRCIRHNQQPADRFAIDELKDTILNKTDILVAFNAKFELSWLKAIGIDYTGKIADPMIMAYVLARGQKWSMSLKELCKRYEVEEKSDAVDEYLKADVSFEDIPWDIVEEYGKQDVVSTYALYQRLKRELDDNPHLWTTVDLMHEFCLCLTDMEANGIKIDVNALDKLEKQYRIEYNELEIKLNKMIKEVMGDTSINLNSPEQLSQLLYSRKVINKNTWKIIFNLGSELRGSVVKTKRPSKMSDKDFIDAVRTHTEILYKTISETCETCEGSGRIREDTRPTISRNNKDFKSNSLQSSKISKCTVCSGQGILFQRLSEIAGFKIVPKGAKDTAAGGFSTDKQTIVELLGRVSGSAKEFISAYTRYSQIDTYLNTFVDGIRKTLINDYIHTSFMQAVTATGRLSSRNPNFQNQPRGNTFEVKRCIVSRFDGGVITEADARQLEFRVAGELSGDKQIFEDVIAGIDVHDATAKHTGFSRQDSKPHTFAPVYGAVPQGKPEHIARYYLYFKDHYRGLSEAHISWGESVLSNDGIYRLPSGREYYYPNTIRYKNGSISNSTIIKNYPVQGFATADIVPLWNIEYRKILIKNSAKSLLILTVHDSLVTDTHSDEIDKIKDWYEESWYSATKIQPQLRWNYEIKIPLDIEVKQGLNWLDMKEI